MHHNHNIQTPEKFFEGHDDFVYASLIDSVKESRLVYTMTLFSETLLSRLKNDKEFCSKFYTAEIRGFTLKWAPNDFPKKTSEYTIAFDDVYVGSKKGLSPIVHNSAVLDENVKIIKWLDPNFRKFLFDLG